MSNLKYEDEYYNPNIKNKYLEQHNDGTKLIYDRLFKISSASEEQLGKDLYEFNREQLRKLFYRFNPKTAYAARSTGRYANLYIEYAISTNKRKGLNPLDGITNDWYQQFVNTTVKKLFTDTELNEIMMKCSNAQDAVIIALLMESVRGNGCSEILNLKREHIVNNQLHLINDKGKQRTITVSDDCINWCHKALREFEYEKNNALHTKSPTVNLVQNNFVVRSSITHTLSFDEAEVNIIHRRLAVIGENNDNLTPSAIYNSGALAMLKDIYLHTNRVGEEEYRMIFQKFNVSIQTQKRMIADFLNLKTLKEVYGIK